MAHGDWNQTAQNGTGSSELEHKTAMHVEMETKHNIGKVKIASVRTVLHRALCITGVLNMQHSMNSTSIHNKTGTARDIRHNER